MFWGGLLPRQADQDALFGRPMMADRRVMQDVVF
jgi:hypothetical protein